MKKNGKKNTSIPQDYISGEGYSTLLADNDVSHRSILNAEVDPNYAVNKNSRKELLLESYKAAFSSVLNITPASVVQGLLLSEIIGPPRCMRQRR